MVTLTPVANHNWYMDFGVTHYFSPNYHMLNSLMPFTENDQMTIWDDDKQLPISHIGSTLLPSLHFSLLVLNILLLLVALPIFENPTMSQTKNKHPITCSKVGITNSKLFLSHVVGGPFEPHTLT